MAYSYTLYTGNGSTTQFAVPFSFLDRTHVSVTVSGASTAFSWVNDGLVSITPAPSNGAVVEIIRTTTKTPEAVFTNSSSLNGVDLNNNVTQAIYLAEEALDRANQGLGLAADGINMDARGLRIENVADPVANGDAATRSYVSTVVSASLQGVASTGGAFVNVRDATFGALGNNTTNDYAAINAAIAYVAARGGGTVYLPATGAPYRITTGLVIPNGVRLLGDCARNYEGMTVTPAQWAQYGTWIRSEDPTNATVTLGGHGSSLEGVNFIRNQVVPGGTFAPTIFPYEIVVGGDFCRVVDFVIMGASHGVDITFPAGSGGGAGVIIRNGLIGAHRIGLRTQFVNDCIHISDLDIRNLWYDTNALVVADLETNMVGWWCGYTDNPFVSGLQIFQASVGILFTDQTCFGNTHSLYNGQLTNVQILLPRAAMKVASTTTTVNAQFSNLMAQGDTTTGLADILFQLGSDNVDLKIAGFSVPATGGQIMVLGNGTGGKVYASCVQVRGYSQIASGQSGFVLNAGAKFRLTAPDIIKNGNSPGQVYAGAGAGNAGVVGNHFAWSPFTSFDQVTNNCNGAAQLVTVDNYMVPDSIGAKQIRIEGQANVTTPLAGTVNLSVSGFGECVASFSSAAGGAVNFDSNWVDMTSSTAAMLGRILQTGPNGAVFKLGNLTLHLR